MTAEKNTQRDVLIIDDDKDVCEMLKEFCERMGCFKNIVFAHDGMMASQKLRNQKFAVILLDMHLPKKTGYDMLGEFEAGSINQKDSILVVSGTLEKNLIAKVIQSGVKNFLVKPFDEPGLQEKILKILSAI